MPKVPLRTSMPVRPSPVTLAPLPMKASVVLLMTVTPTAAPIAAVPAPPAAPTTRSISLRSSAAISTVPAACTLPAPSEATASAGSSPMKARVMKLNTGTPAAPITLTVPAPPAAAATPVKSSYELDRTRMLPSDVAVTPEPMKASVCLVMTLTLALAPMPAVPPMPIEPDTTTMSVLSCAVTLMPPRVNGLEVDASTLAPLPTNARVVSFRTLTTAEPAMPAVLDPPPAAAMVSRFSYESALMTRSLPFAVAPAPT